jgi:ATP-dependent DNA ligase
MNNLEEIYNTKCSTPSDINEHLPVLKKYPGLHLVGELWKKGFGLQDISGSSRRQLDSKIKEAAIKLDFNIFDCFYLHEEQKFEDRQGILDDLFMDLEDHDKANNTESHVKMIETFTVKNKEQLLAKYEEFLADNLEGGVIRNLDSIYEAGIDKEKRSYTTLKIKPRPDAEWPVVGFKDGNGKEAGAVIWVCAENDEGVTNRLNLTQKDELPPISERKQFSVTPNMDYETRQKIFEKLTNSKLFQEKIESQLLTINYSILSKDYLPQQPKAIRFREQSINDLLLA